MNATVGRPGLKGIEHLSAAAFQRGAMPDLGDAISIGRAERLAMKAAAFSVYLRVTIERLTLIRREPWGTFPPHMAMGFEFLSDRGY